MQKAKAKAKKKNVETGLLMGQNTNVFSQLSATILQNKASNTEQEARFLQNTQIVEYHDPQVSRLIALLRKKAEVTKVKAANQLRELVAKMSVQQTEEFASTFAHLYLEIVMNEPSKAILEEFIAMVEDVLQKHKKAIISEISTFYPPLLITHKLNKLAPLLFAGSEQQMPKKIIVLLLKKEVAKKFIVMVRMILDSQAIKKIAQPQMQRNCQALTKLLRDLIRIFDKTDKLSEQEPQFSRLIQQVCDSLGENCIAQYFKVGGRAKASILELYSSLVSIAARRPKWDIQWKPYAKIVGESFLDKDPIVQQALWRGAIHLWLESLSELEKRSEKDVESLRLLDVFLPKYEDKLLQALGIGGFALYKQLPRLCQIFPSTMIGTEETHKQLVNKLTFFRKLLNGLLGQEDESEARMECYASLVQLMLKRIRGITLPADEKKAKQVQSLAVKFQKEAFQNLQDRYYNEPPVSKNSLSYYIPQHFSALLESLQPTFDFKFHPQMTYSLYQGLSLSPYSSKIIDSIFLYSEKSQSLTLKYLQVFPKKNVEVDMSETNSEVQNAAKIFLLACDTTLQKQKWIKPDWDIRKQLIVFDPRISLRDLDAEQSEEQQHLYSLYFRPTHRALPSRYDCPQLDSSRFAYFKECLFNPENSQYVRYLLPLMNDILLPRNNVFSDELFEIFAQKCKLAFEGKWAVGAHEVLVVRVLVQLLIQTLVREKGFDKFKQQNVERCLLTMSEFVRLLTVYKMDNEAEDLLRRLQGLLVVEDARPIIFDSSSIALQRAWALLLKGKIEGADKVRKNRIKKCLELTHRLLSFSVPNAQIKLPEKLAVQFLGEENNWKEAVIRSEPWHILHAILGNVFGEGHSKVVSFLLENHEKNNLQIGLLLALDVLLPLQALPDIRRKLLQLKEHLQRQICKLCYKKLQALLDSLVKRAMTERLVQISEGVRRLIVQLLLEREADSSALLEVLENSIVVQPFNQFIRSSQELHRALIYNTTASAVPLKRIKQSESICADLTSDLLRAEGLNYFVILSTSCLFWNKGVGSAQLIQHEAALLKQVVASALKIDPQCDSTLSSNFVSYSLFTLINTAIGLGGWSCVEKFEQDINQLFWQEKKRGQLEGLALSVKMKYASRAVLAVGGPALCKFIKQLPEIIKAQLNYNSAVLDSMESDDQQTYHQSVVTLFVQSAQFLLRANAFVNKQQMPNEATLLTLVQCPFPALKKAAFVLLKTIYQGCMVARSLPSEYKIGLKTEIRGEQLNGELCRQALGYFYTWQLLILRREATERQPESEEEMPISLQDVIQSEGLSQLLLKNCFFIIEDILEYLKHEAEFPLSPEELLDHELEKDFWQEGQAQRRMFRLAVRTLFVFICNFPIFLRDCMDRFKKYRTACERLLRSVVSEAIFRQEVLRIQMLQSEWKKGGNFDIYVISSNREIYAQYTHDVIRIGLRLVMRPTYPLTPIAIEFGEGLKIEEGSRWGLMLQSQLHNRNSSIIKGILLWKENVDRKLAGVQECAICFDIVNSHGQLPKKACKTCRKKFHGNCIMKWFSKSNKSECPLCKSQFL